MLIGPSFGYELGTAGISGLPFSWSSSEITFSPAMTAAQKAQVQAVLDAHDPTKPAVVIPTSVTDWQFAGQAASEGIISLDEAKAWVGPGTVPASLLTAVGNAISDPSTHDKVVLFLMGTKEFPRYHALTPLLAASFGKDTTSKLDQFFVNASQR